MGLSPRTAGKTAARASNSPAPRALLNKIEPFFAGEEVSGGPMLLAALVALICFNLPFGAAFAHIWDSEVSVSFGKASISRSLAEWINDALLPLFFVIIGAEVKREIVAGELAQWRTASLPLFGALGGMLVPVALFVLINEPTGSVRGWGTVVATDTAFGLAVVAMFGTSLPSGVRALLLAFAAIDDVGGLGVIAIAYTSHVAIVGLLVASACLGGMVALRAIRWVSTLPYILLAVLAWAGVFISGVHPTIAGVLIGAVAAVYPRFSPEHFSHAIQHHVDQFQSAHRNSRDGADATGRREALDRSENRLGYLQEMAHATDGPSDRLIGLLNPWVSYVVLPLFALSNVRVPLSATMLEGAVRSPIAAGIVVGLVFGKPLGFVGFTWLAEILGLAERPEGVTRTMMVGVGALAGIGFTISLFIASIAFARPETMEQASLAILIASCVSGAIGYVVLRRSVRSD